MVSRKSESPLKTRDAAIERSRKIQQQEGPMAAKKWLVELAADLAHEAIEEWDHLSEYEPWIGAVKTSAKVEFKNEAELVHKLSGLHGPYVDRPERTKAAYLSTANLDLDREDNGYERQFRRDLAKALNTRAPRKAFKRALRLASDLVGTQRATQAVGRSLTAAEAPPTRASACAKKARLQQVQLKKEEDC